LSGQPAKIARREVTLSARKSGQALVPVTVAVPEDVRISHTEPGQYVSIDAGGEDGYFVLASPVGAPAWTFLVKGGGATADALRDVPMGSKVMVSRALGEGFPCVEARGRPLLIALAGTGIAAAPALAARRIADGDGARTWMLLGVQHAADLPWHEELAAWRRASVRALLCVSREDGDGETSVHGYVQAIATSHVPRAEGTMVFTVGPEAMVQAIRALGPSLGANAADVRTNY
jgi:NAD(P)H-flavin reductase